MHLFGDLDESLNVYAALNPAHVISVTKNQIVVRALKSGALCIAPIAAGSTKHDEAAEQI